jgi:hypothetical protein
LNVHGDNIGNVVQFMEREHKDRFTSILDRIASKIPGIAKIDTKVTDDKRVLLRFNDGAFGDPFLCSADVRRHAEDVCLPVAAGRSLIRLRSSASRSRRTGCITSYWRLWPRNSERMPPVKKNAPQVFVTTHQPYFVDALSPEGGLDSGKGTGRLFYHPPSISELVVVKNLVAEGLPLGGLWYSDYLDAR